MKPTVEQLVAAASADWTPGRYPYTYACDYIRSHPEVVPAHIRDQVTPDSPSMYSRAEASELRKLWAEAAGCSDEELAGMLADAYMQVFNVRRTEKTP